MPNVIEVSVAFCGMLFNAKIVCGFVGFLTSVELKVVNTQLE